MDKTSRRFKKKEFQRLLELSFALSQKESEKGDLYSLDVVKSTAEEMGIGSDKISQALLILDKETAKKRRRNRNIAIGAVVLMFVATIVAYATWPRHFSGTLKITMCSAVDDNFNALDDLTEFDLFCQDKAYALLTFFDLRYQHLIKWEFYDAAGELADKVDLQLSTAGTKYNAYAYCPLSLKSPPGEWLVKVFADKDLIGEKRFAVKFGKMDLTLTSEMKDDVPVNSLDSFSPATHEKVYCYLYWTRISGKYTVEWKWINPDADIAEIDTYDINPTHASWWVYNSMKVKEAKPGQWKVEIYLAGTKIGEKAFTITSG